MITTEKIMMAVKHKINTISYGNRDPEEMFNQTKGYLQALTDMELITPKSYLNLMDLAQEVYKKEVSP